MPSTGLFPFGSLPIEVFVGIVSWTIPRLPLDHYVDWKVVDFQARYDPGLLCLVSKSWAAVICASPALWTVVCRPLAAARRALELSGKLPVIIKYETRNPLTDTQDQRAFLEVILPHKRRWSAIYGVDLFTYADWDILHATFDAPSLRELKTWDSHPVTSFPSAWPWTDGISPPALPVTVLTVTPLAHYEFRMFNSLVDVWITGLETRESCELRAFIDACRPLRTLDVQWMTMKFQHQDPIDMQKITAPSLEVLRLRNAPTSSASELFTVLSAPRLYELAVLTAPDPKPYLFSGFRKWQETHDLLPRVVHGDAPLEVFVVHGVDGTEVFNRPRTVRLFQRGDAGVGQILPYIQHAFRLDEREGWLMVVRVEDTTVASSDIIRASVVPVEIDSMPGEPGWEQGFRLIHRMKGDEVDRAHI